MVVNNKTVGNMYRLCRVSEGASWDEKRLIPSRHASHKTLFVRHFSHKKKIHHMLLRVRLTLKK